MGSIPMISAVKRKSLPETKFALPDKRKYPIDTAARTRNAAARLEQAKKVGKVTSADYATAKRRIAAAAKRFGIESQYNAKMDLGVADVHSPGQIQARKIVPGRRGLHMYIGADGAMEVRHATDSFAALMFDALPFEEPRRRLARLADIEIALPAADEATALALRAEQETITKPVWIQIAKVGVFKGHSAGPFELTPGIFADICRNFTQVDKGQVPVDFEHASEADAADGSIPQAGAPAQGWVRAVENRGTSGLWGLVEWLEPARSYIREGKYQAVSPAIRFGAKHPETGVPIGARLTSVALTNRPYLRGMQPVTARDNQEKTMLDMPMTAHGEFMPRMRAALKLPEIATYQEMADHLDRVREMCMGAVAAGSDPMGVFEGVALGDYIAPMRALMNMPANATLEQMFDAVEEMIDAAMERHNAIYHTTDDATDSAPMADTATTGDTAMADEKKLKDIESERDGALAKLMDAEKREASLSLRLKDAESKIVDKDRAIETKDAEIAKLKDDAAKRAETDLTVRVDDAFATYKDAKKLTDADKTAMRIVLKADPATFDALYPRVAPNHQHILRNLTGADGNTGASAQRATMRQAANAGAPKPGYQDLVRKLKDENLKAGMKLEDAIAKAATDARNAA